MLTFTFLLINLISTCFVFYGTGCFNIFGLSCSDWPWLHGFFTRVVKKLVLISHSRGIRLLVFLDDWLMFVGSRESVRNRRDSFSLSLPKWDSTFTRRSLTLVCAPWHGGRHVVFHDTPHREEISGVDWNHRSVVEGRCCFLRAVVRASVGVGAHSEPSFFGKSLQETTSAGCSEEFRDQRSMGPQGVSLRLAPHCHRTVTGFSRFRVVLEARLCICTWTRQG